MDGHLQPFPKNSRKLSNGRPTTGPTDCRSGHGLWSWSVDRDPKTLVSEASRQLIGWIVGQSTDRRLAPTTFKSGLFGLFVMHWTPKLHHLTPKLHDFCQFYPCKLIRTYPNQSSTKSSSILEQNKRE